MKKIEAVIIAKNFNSIKYEIHGVGSYIIDKRDLDHSQIFYESKGSRVGSTGLKSIPLSKIEVVVHDKAARKVVEIISEMSGVSAQNGGKIFVSEMSEVVDMETLDSKMDLEVDESEANETPTTKRSRLVPLQKFTLNKLEKIYNENEENLKIYYRIKSFSDFVNLCIMKSLPAIEKQLKNPVVVYENNFGDF
ncbi:MAG: P-II family nitrogen regulator [Nitrosopumilus sp.]